LRFEECLGLGRGAHGEAQQNGDRVDDGVSGGVGQTLGHAALLEQVAQAQEAHQGQTARGDQRRDEKAADWKEYFLPLADPAGLLHSDEPLLLRGQQFHDGRLDDWHQAHIGIRRNGDGPQQVRRELGREEYRGGAVGAADDPDGRGLGGDEAQVERADHRQEDAYLRRGAQEDELWVGDHVGEVGHGADAQEDERREDALRDAKIDVRQHAARIVHRERHARGQGNVAHDGPETDGHQQQGLVVLGDAQRNEGNPDGEHDHVAERQVDDARGSDKLPKNIH